MENEIPWYKNKWAWVFIVLMVLIIGYVVLKMFGPLKKPFIEISNSDQISEIYGTKKDNSLLVTGKTNKKSVVTLLEKFGSDSYAPMNKTTADNDGNFRFHTIGDSTQTTYVVSTSQDAYNQSDSSDHFFSRKELIPYSKFEFIPTRISKVSSDTRTSKKPATKSYKSIDKVFNVNKIMSYSDNELFGKYVKITGNITSLGADNSKQYHILLTGNSSSQKYLIVVNSSKTGKLTEHSNATVYGTITGKSHVNDNQINSGISENYYKDPIILVDADKVS
ncbi:hypothetical protein UCCLBBS449_1668 [Levilactobacillus brevis]|uniref:Uncharacterized protein n=1 Tax=Levilactobacillus brevis TaxID=1580 RepID=A0A5B7Y151_LEVBR|nr:hypothetical protein [Levilactobacillus brevis]KIO93959.1 hypothetical protein N624_0073 [Levilactobacillus brevis]QCZ53603.1 hypothetical protein UCCLBBS449_1668 [Levilactobacillus brevis]